MANQYTDVKGSSSFDDWVKKFKHDNGIMCYLDVSSLFTNGPLDETIDSRVEVGVTRTTLICVPREGLTSVRRNGSNAKMRTLKTSATLECVR